MSEDCDQNVLGGKHFKSKRKCFSRIKFTDYTFILKFDLFTSTNFLHVAVLFLPKRKPIYVAYLLFVQIKGAPGTHLSILYW